MRPCHINRLFRLTMCLVLLAVPFTPAGAVSRYWVCDTLSFWSEPSCWSATLGGSGGAGLPAAGDIARFQFSDAIDRTTGLSTFTTTPVLSSFVIGNSGSGSTDFIQTGGSLTSDFSSIGSGSGNGLGGTATYTQQGGDQQNDRQCIRFGNRL